MSITLNPTTGLVDLTLELESGAIIRYTLPPAEAVPVKTIAKGIQKLTERIRAADELAASIADLERERHVIDNEQRQAVVVAVREGTKPPKGFKRRLRELDEDISDSRAIRNAAARVAYEAGIELRGQYQAQRAQLEGKAIAEARAAIESIGSALKILTGAQQRHAAALGVLAAFGRSDVNGGVLELVHTVPFAGANGFANAVNAARAAIGATVGELDDLTASKSGD